MQFCYTRYVCTARKTCVRFSFSRPSLRFDFSLRWLQVQVQSVHYSSVHGRGVTLSKRSFLLSPIILIKNSQKLRSNCLRLQSFLAEPIETIISGDMGVGYERLWDHTGLNNDFYKAVPDTLSWLRAIVIFLRTCSNNILIIDRRHVNSLNKHYFINYIYNFRRCIYLWLFNPVISSEKTSSTEDIFYETADF